MTKFMRALLAGVFAFSMGSTQAALVDRGGAAQIRKR